MKKRRPKPQKIKRTPKPGGRTITVREPDGSLAGRIHQLSRHSFRYAGIKFTTKLAAFRAVVEDSVYVHRGSR